MKDGDNEHCCFGFFYHEDYVDGSVYKGNWKNGKRHGQGTLTTNRFKYVGSFYKGKRQGYGNFTGETGYSYEGNFLNSYKHGKEGKEIFREKNKGTTMFKGKYVNGLK